MGWVMGNFPLFDLSKVTTYSLESKQLKVTQADMIYPGDVQLVRSAGGYYKSSEFRELQKLANTIAQPTPTILCLGGATIKVGLAPLIIDLMKRGLISCLSMPGATAIHDIELAVHGATSEDVLTNVGNGTFGLHTEGAEVYRRALERSKANGRGLGQCLGDVLSWWNGISDRGFANSILIQAYALNVPVTVHVALGTDIIHMHDIDWASLGLASGRDFLILAEVLRLMGEGGYGSIVNVGSATIMPEVLVKALTLAVNVGGDFSGVLAANFDFSPSYRGNTRVIDVIEKLGGWGHSFVGHHQLLFPILYALITEVADGKD